MTVDYKRLVKLIRTIREHLEYTQEMVATALHMTRSAYCQIERGKARPGLQTLITLSELFDVPFLCFIYPDEYKIEMTQAKTKSKTAMLSKDETRLIALVRTCDYIYSKPELLGQLLETAQHRLIGYNKVLVSAKPKTPLN